MRYPVLVVALAASACGAPLPRGSASAHGPSRRALDTTKPNRPAPAREAEEGASQASVAPSAAEPEIPPLTADLRIALDPAVDPASAVCRVHGTGTPFSGACDEPSVLLSADEEAAVPIAKVSSRRVDVEFDLAPGSATAWTTIAQGKVRVSGFTPLAKQTFRLTRDAVALGGHVHLKADAPATIVAVSVNELSVTTNGDIVNIEDVVASTRCDAVSFDPFEDKQLEGSALGDGSVTPRGKVMHLSVAPGEAPMLTLQGSNDQPLSLSLTVLDRVQDQRRVAFSTDRARFDVWVPSEEIDENGGARGGFGIGRGFCTKGSDGMLGPAWEATRDIDVLVAKRPRDHGPRGVKLLKGARVAAWGGENGWSEIAILDAPISAPKGLSYWVPTASLRERP